MAKTINKRHAVDRTTFTVTCSIWKAPILRQEHFDPAQKALGIVKCEISHLL